MPQRSRFGHTLMAPPTPKPTFQPFVEESDQPPTMWVTPTITSWFTSRNPRFLLSNSQRAAHSWILWLKATSEMFAHVLVLTFPSYICSWKYYLCFFLFVLASPSLRTPCKINPAVNTVLSTRKPCREETPLKRLQEHQHEQQQEGGKAQVQSMYCKELLFSGASEFCFEELRAERYRQKMVQESEDKGQKDQVGAGAATWCISSKTDIILYMVYFRRFSTFYVIFLSQYHVLITMYCLSEHRYCCLCFVQRIVVETTTK